MDAKLQENVTQVNVSLKHACPQVTFLCTIYLHIDVYNQHDTGEIKETQYENVKDEETTGGEHEYLFTLRVSVVRFLPEAMTFPSLMNMQLINKKYSLVKN